MTAQIHDHVTWRNDDYMLVAVDGNGLFNPLDHGLDPQATTTANWRGWVARYEIRDDHLILTELHGVGLSSDPENPPPTLNGVRAQRDGPGTHSYPGLDWPIAFSGRLLIARGFIQSLYRHMGFHPAWKFEVSWELDLDRGQMTSARDLSGEMSLLREKIKTDGSLDPDAETRPGWIERTFRLDFRRSKGH
jgi:hypothetical protein